MIELAPPLISMSEPDITSADIEAVVSVLNSKRLSLGPRLDDFEAAFAAYIGTKYAVGVSSGTGGLHCAVRAAKIGANDEVLTTPFSFIASANCILFEGARPVFVDIDEDAMTLDHRLLPGAINERTRAVLPVHVFGQPCAMDEILAVANSHGLQVIEDACEAIGAEHRGRKVGAFGRAAVFSFYPNKQMTTGEGGIVTTDDPSIAHELRSLRNQGRDVVGTWLNHSQLGYNYRLSEISAALGLSQLSRIEDLLARREKVADHYKERLRDVPGVKLIKPAATTTRLSWFALVIRLDSTISRELLIRQLENMGVPTRAYFTPIHLHPFYLERFGYKEGSLPVTERIARSVLTLPFHSNFSEASVDFVVDCLSRAMQVAYA